ncbi:PAS domain S-box protein [Sphingomonas suaedae]|uniref:histidine kinase n=1 Tax=Sphingomonas suaedae TaxID=2599297 RepID=A0A518RD74_9SPHN|nr:PAS domain S-box protein [Sphingomonas suaedae]QDX25386.1 PAS domain S-box protein [Sphingomonas suaedae]
MSTSLEVPTFLADGGEMGRRIATFDWGATSVGPVATWSSSLRAIVAFLIHCPVPIVMLWGEDGILIYNDGYSVFAGDRHPGLLGMKVLEAWPEVADFNANVMRVGLAGGTLAYRNHRLSLNRTGVFEDCWLDLDYSPVYDGEGAPAGVLAVVVETTEAVLANRALSESEARLRFLDTLDRETARSTDLAEVLEITTRMLAAELGASNCAYADMDADEDGFTIRGDWAREGSPSIVGHYQLADFGALAVQQLRAGRPLIIDDNLAELAPHEAEAFQAIGISATVCIPLVKDGRLKALMAAHHREPHVWTPEEVTLIREVTDRSWAHVERTAAQAELRRTAAQLRELNAELERRVVERAAALQQSQTQFGLLVRGVTDYAIYMLDTDGVVSSWNAGAERIKGYTPEEIMGRHFSTFYPDEERLRGDPERALETARREGRFAAEGWRLRKDGSRFRASVAIDAIRDDDGQLIGFAKITRDVTEREETQRELEVAREALFQSQKIEAIGQLTGGVAHDFNNLLMAIMSGLTLLKKRVPDDPQISRLIENSMQAAERGAALTQRMLAFARRQQLKTERVDVAALVADMQGLLQRTIGPAWRIEARFPDDLSAVAADTNQLEMALLNLVVNARDAMQEGGTIRISAAQRAIPEARGNLAAGPYVRLSVCDEGQGMDPDTLARATEPFFTTKGVGKGTGLGLSMIHGFAQQNGGALEIESTPGIGTRAHIWLPLATEGSAPALARVEEDAEVAGQALAILVVDDDPLVLTNTAALLADLGHTVFEADSGHAALARLEVHDEIALLITDQAMPGMTGSQLVAQVRAVRPDLPIILATGYGEMPADGAARVQRLAKPFTQGDLRRALAEAVPAEP